MEEDRGEGRPREKRVEGVREGEEEGAGSGRKREKITQHCGIFRNRKMQRGGSQQIQGGNQDYRVREAGGLNPPAPPPKKKTEFIPTRVVSSVYHLTKVRLLKEKYRMKTVYKAALFISNQG